MFCTIQRCPVCKPNGESDWGRASFAAECMPYLVAPALGVSRSDLDAHNMWRLAGLSTNEARAAYGLSPIDSKESFSNQIGSPCHAPPIDEPSPPGFADFVAVVRKRLEPFGVEVRFEIGTEIDFARDDAPIVSVYAGKKHGGAVIQAKRCFPAGSLAERLRQGRSAGAVVSESIIAEIQDKIANAQPSQNGITGTYAAFVAMANQDDAPINLEAKKIPCPACSHLASATCFMCGRDGESDDCQPLIVNGE